MLRDALALAKRGTYVFPCLPRGKTPATSRGFKDASVDPDVIRAWWRQADFNIGIATGAISGILVIDIDGIDAEAELAKLERDHGALPASVEVITARGRHVYLRWPEAAVRNSASRLAPGIDIRGDGGYVIAPPSIHPSGRRYMWSVDSASAFAEPPLWLLNLIAAPAAGAAAPTPPSTWRDLVRDGVGEGARNDRLARLAGHLFRRFIDPLVALELLLAFNMDKCRPPLPDAEVETIVASVAGREIARRTRP
jgi:hypothetical protein